MKSNTIHKVIITGTGRTGTTLLVQLLTDLGLDTGFRDIHDDILEYCNAGMEHLLRDTSAPYIVKSPWICDLLESDLKHGDIVIDHAFIPVRSLHDAAASRIAVWDKIRHTRDHDIFGAPGSLWHTVDPEQQESALAKQLYKLIYTIVSCDIPHTFLDFPRFANDPNYLYGKLQPLIGGTEYEAFLQAFNRVVNVSLIHDFSQQDTPR